mgnify:FL=1
MEMHFDITMAGNKKVDARFRGFTVHTDQPISDGGDNTAPAAFELFLASIGACAGYFIISFCEARNIPYDKIKIQQTASRNDKTHMVEKVALDNELPPDFPEKYKAALVKAADSFTVKKHLVTPPEIKVQAI